MAEPQVSTFVRGGKAFLRNESGQLTTHDPSKVAGRVLSGRYTPVTSEEVAAREAEKAAQEEGGVVGTAKTLGETAAAGAFDVAMLPFHAANVATEAATGEKLGDVPSGRDFTESLAGAAELFRKGGDPRKGRQEYRESAEARREANPIASTVGRLGGEVAGMALTGGASLAAGLGERVAARTGSRIAGLGTAGAVEGAALGAAQAPEEAYFKDEDLTAESLLAGMGWGALLGGGVGVGIGGAGRFFSRSGSRGMTPLDSPSGSSSRAEAAMEETATRITGDAAAPGLGAKLRDAVESVQSGATGADRETLREFGAFRWDSKARAGRAMWRDREKILEGATADLTTQVDDIVQKSRAVTDEVVDSGLKREHIASKLQGEPAAQLAAAREEAARLVDAVEQIAQRSDEFGNVALSKRLNQYIGERATEIAATDDAAAAFIALDKAKRGMQRWAQSLRQSGRMSTDALNRQQAFALGDELARVQEGTRQKLMDTGIWGAAADDQKAINSAWEKFFESQRMFDSHFIARTGSDFDGRAIVAADPAKVASYVRGLGKAEKALVDQHFRAHVQALDELTGAIGKAFDVGPKKAAVDSVRESARRVSATLKRADETVKVANQIDAVIEAERGSGASVIGGLFGGGLLGGGPGAVLGAGFGAVTRPGQMIRQAAALDVMMQNVEKRIGKSVSGFFDRNVSRVAQNAPKGTPTRRAPAGARTAAALELFQGKEGDPVKAYRKRVKEVVSATDAFGAVVRDRTEQALGDLPLRAPKLAGKVATAATRGAVFLSTKIPTPTTNQKSLTPNADAPIPSGVEIAKFARYWSAVSNPLSVLRDLEEGTVTREQVEAVQAVYPRLYQRVQETVRERIMAADEKGVRIPYQARLQLDLLLDLGGAGEPTATPDFMVRFQDMTAATAQQAAATPPPQPINISGRLRASRDRMESDQS